MISSPDPPPASPWRFCVAPMMDWTDRHCRSFHRALSRRARLYTEMVTASAVIRGNREQLIGFSAAEHPLAIQLGGSTPAELAEAARIAEQFGYAEINMNVGCPSDRVKGGHFGACLMAEPGLVAECVAAMKQAVKVPVTVKCRIGIDDQDPDASLFGLAEAVVPAGADALIVHARKAWLKGLSPKQNREVPPLDYGIVKRLKLAYPGTPVVINGGIASLAAAKTLLADLDGVMLGRAAYQDPELLLTVDDELFDAPAPAGDVLRALEKFRPYIASRLAPDGKLHNITRHMLGLFPGRPGARLYRRILATEANRPGAGLEVLDKAVAAIGEAAKPVLAAA